MLDLRRIRKIGMICAVFAAATVSLAAKNRVELVWPTPSEVWERGRPAHEFLQHAGSGDPDSGGFGGVRSGGRQFHEGIDIKPVARDRKGEPKDDVFAAMDGVVRHVSRVAGKSSYGRYIVLEHPAASPAVYTLYAHLARIEIEITPGAQVRRGQVLGLMGHSSGGYSLPKDRSHLHFEIGVAVTRDFQTWYNARKFGSPNDHGMWNGMNLMGIDPLDFYNQWRARKVNTFDDYFAKMEPAVRVRIATRKTPDFVQRYPSLVTRPLPMIVAGWEIRFNWSGIPYQWTPLTSAEAAGLELNRPKVVEADAEVVKRDRSRTLAVKVRGEWRAASDLEIVLQQLFGIR
jgi:murein DD-endopeptidase MepM/ murein hydrolase activator NlpD